MNAAAVSQAGLALIQDYEGFRAEPAQLPNGAWLVGYGHLRTEAGEPVNEAEAVNLLSADLAPFEALVRAKVARTLTQSQFDALVSFAFSIGAQAFEQSQVLRRVNAGEFVAAACAMDAWRKSDVAGEPEVFAALIARRAAEKVMLLQDMPRKAAPSAVLRAQLDHAASILGAPVRFAVAPEIASPQVVAPSPEASASVAQTSNSQALEPLVPTQVVANDVDGVFTAANDEANDEANDAADDAANDGASDAANDSAGAAPDDAANDAVPEATAPVAESSQALEPLLLTQVVANDVDGAFSAANDPVHDAAADAADDTAFDAADDAADDTVNDGANAAANATTNDVADDTTRAATQDARPIHTIAFVELPIDRRIRNGRKGGIVHGLKSLWGVFRSPKAEHA